MSNHAIFAAAAIAVTLIFSGVPQRAIAQLPSANQAPDFTGLTLVQAERLLRERNRELQAARRAVESAQANTLSAGARPNPNLGLGVSALSPQSGIGGGALRDKAMDSSIRIDQLIERGDKRVLRIATAKGLESASGEDLSDVHRQQRLALHAAYYDLRLAQDKAGIAADNAALFARSIQAAESRLKAGDIAAADVSRLRVDALRAANDARSAEADRYRAQLALAYLIGAETQADTILAADDWPASDGADIGEIGDAMIDARPDVRAARARAEAAISARDLARSLRTRDVTVGAQFDHYPSNGANVNGTGNSYGLFVSVPLFTGYYYEGEVRAAEVHHDAALELLEKTRAQARSELFRARSDLLASAERLKRYNEALLGEAKKAADAAEFAYGKGAIGVMDLLDARRTLRAIQFDAAVARSDHAKALAAWQAGIGDMK